MQEASKAYDLHIKMLNASDPASFTETERTLAVEEILRRRKLKAGEFHGQEDGSAWADGAFPEIGYEIRPDSNIDRARTFQEEVTMGKSGCWLGQKAISPRWIYMSMVGHFE